MGATKFLVLLLGALLVAGSFSSADAALDRIQRRQRCYDKCMKKHGWDPVCVYSPKYPKPTPHLPYAQWVMPNACTMRCQERFAKYVEYFDLEKKGKASVPKHCQKHIQEIYFDWSKPDKDCTTC